MAYRKVIFSPDEIYHIYNRSIAGRPIFTFKKNKERALFALYFYQKTPLPSSLSHYLQATVKQRKVLDKLLDKAKRLIDIYAFCLMPNHFHLLVKENKEKGISKFLADFQNSYTRYYNLFHESKGHVFQGQFEAVRVETDEQLLHVSRYIHLNPYSSFVVKDYEELKEYQWSSLPEYLGNNKKSYEIYQKDYLINFFKDLKEFEQFIFNQKDYQRELETIKHLILEE